MSSHLVDILSAGRVDPGVQLPVPPSTSSHGHTDSGARELGHTPGQEGEDSGLNVGVLGVESESG